MMLPIVVNIIVLYVICLNIVLTVERKIIDLTWKFDKETVYWNGVKKFEFTKIKADDENGFWMAMNEFCAAEHGGTHLDAPYHFNKNGWKVGDIPTDRLIVPAQTIDVRAEVAKDGANFELRPSHLQKWKNENGEFLDGSVLIVRFGWSKYWHNRTEYLGLLGDQMNFPGLSKDAARWTADSGKFYGVGVDTSSGDPGSSEEFWAHRELTSKNLYILENVKILEDLPVSNYTLVVAPMDIGRGTGGPLRLFAIIDNFV